ncbi:MAG: PKD domain-containing protein [Acidobacteria bacterium]|nr:PKD domain-containing protein [Acidobacteriota bacterium]
MTRNSNTSRRTSRFNLNFRITLIALGLLVAVMAVLMVTGRKASAQAGVPATCTPPGTTVVTDPAGDQTGAPASNQALDLISISLAEPAASADDTGAFVNKLVFTIKVSNLSTVPANGIWQSRFTLGATTYYVSAKSDNNAALTYEYGTISGTTVSPTGTPDAGSVDKPGNKFVITIANNKVGNPVAGQTLSVRGVTQLNGIIVFTGVDSTSTNVYTVVGNASCAAAATPTPTPTPAAGGTCNATGQSIVTDPANDHNTTVGTSQQDIREVLIAEPYFADGSSKLIFTMKVESLDPNNLPANGIWKIYFKLGTTTYFVNAFHDPALGNSFAYGSKDANNIDQTAGAADGGSFDAATKSITITVSNGQVGSPVAGNQLTAITGVTQVLVGSGQVGGSLQQVDTTGAGVYTLNGNAACAPASTPTPTPTPGGGTSPDGPRYTIYAPPSGLGASAGEPSIGVNWKTGKVFFIAGVQTLRITLDDCVSPATATWADVSFPTTNRTTLDPILFTDSKLGRTFVSQLLGKAASTVYTDNDAGTNGQAPGDWVQTQGNGINSGVDHQTIGAGPFAPPLTRDPASMTPYPNAVYYASQDAATAEAAVSLDGGLNYGPAVPMYTLVQCSGIHGHVKVGPDGTAYVPNKSCSGTQGVAVSENNGASWTIRPVTGSTASSALIDPSVGVATDNTIYFGYVNGSGLPFAAVSPGTDTAKNHGKGWINNKRIGAELGIVKATFPQMIAGDPNRASMAFLGSKVPGDHQAPIRDANGAVTTNGYRGEWHLYIATTYDGGVTWTTVDTTPNDPVQRNSICNSGTITCDRKPNDRNLLDFNDLQIDKQGRVYAAFADGCISQSCIQGLDLDNDGYKDNDYSARATFARQSGGLSLFSAYDPAAPTVPKSPVVTATRDASGVHLTWTPPDNGGSPITSYNVYRRTASTTAALIGSTTTTSYDDTTADPNTTYFYHVRAVNAVGESAFCPGNEVVPAPVPDPCTPPGVRVSSDAAGDTAPPPPATPTAMDILSLSVAEPYFGPGVNKLVFTLKTVGGAAPASSQWYIIWSRPAPDATFDRNYVAMKTDATGAISYEYGKVSPPNVNAPTKQGVADSGSYDAATGTITITISNSKVDNVVAPQALSGLDARTFFDRVDGQPVTGLQATDTTAAGSYQLVGNAACKPNALPVAVLNATPTSGIAPLGVNFDASGSSDSDGSIVEYTFDFGDGSPSETRTVAAFGASAAQTAHTYTQPGSYRAVLNVKDSGGAVNANIADKIITVNQGGCSTNWALDSNGATAAASSTYTSRNYQPQHAIDGDRTGVAWESGGGWNDATRDVYPDSLEVAFNGAKPIHEIRVYTLQDNFKQPQTPNETMTCGLYGLLDYDVQYWDGASWVTIQSITGNNKVLRVIPFAEVTTTKIRVVVNNARAHFSRIVEVEAIGCPTP